MVGIVIGCLLLIIIIALLIWLIVFLMRRRRGKYACAILDILFVHCSFYCVLCLDKDFVKGLLIISVLMYTLSFTEVIDILMFVYYRTGSAEDQPKSQAYSKSQ